MAQKTRKQEMGRTVSDEAEAVPLAAEGIRANKPVAAEHSRPAVQKAGGLTFITAEGEHIVFASLEMPLADAAALASEEALSKVWDRPEEDLAWRDM